jgi:hypothetical protein
MKRLTSRIVAFVITGAWLLCIPGLQAQQAAPSGQASTTTGQTSGQSSTATGQNSEASVDRSVTLLRQDLQSKKKQLIAANLELTSEEATKFWPVYDQYSAELSKLGDQRYALIKEYANAYGSLTNDQALSLTKRSLALDDQVAQLRSKYVPIMNQVLPGTKTATFFQLDRYINSLIDLQLASQIPLVQDQK